MKTNKSQKEAVLRAHQSIEGNQQDQEKLYRPTVTSAGATEDPAAAMNESHQNKMENYQNLRKLDVELAKKKNRK